MDDTDAVRDSWDAHGSAYESAFGLSFPAIARTALRHADVQPGLRLLDVAAGGGALSIPAAELGARVLATDLAPGMLELLRERASTAGVSGVRTEVMDGMVSPAEALAAAGYVRVRLHTLELDVEVGSPAGAWEVVSTGMGDLAKLLGACPPRRSTDSVPRSSNLCSSTTPTTPAGFRWR